MAHNQVNEIDELLKDLKKTPGFKAYLILNSDGIVIRWDQADNVAEGSSSQLMTYQSAVQHAHLLQNYIIRVRHILRSCSSRKMVLLKTYDYEQKSMK